MNYMLWSAGMSDWSCISGLTMFMIENTVETTVEKESIHLYFHLRYVIVPAIPIKREYHSLVSPIVLRGGLSSEVHNPAINAANTTVSAVDSRTANLLLLPDSKAVIAPAVHNMIDIAANM